MPEFFTAEECPQGSDAWRALRAGIPTASSFKTMLAKGKGGADSVTRRKYIYTLAGEILTGEVADTFSNQHTERGHEMEPEARRFYEFIYGVDVRPLGFARNGRKGASPDGAIGENGGLEIKTRIPSLQIEVLERDSPPPENKAQVQGQLWVCEWEWIDLISYWPGLPLARWRVHRDEPYIAELTRAHAEFMDELDETVERIRAMQEAA